MTSAPAPGPTDWEYQGVVRMRAEDARALMTQYDWQPDPLSLQIWPALAPFAQANTRWLHSDTYVPIHLHQKYRGDLYLDIDTATAFFDIYEV